MKATYKNEFGNYKDCIVLSCHIGNFSLVLIEFEDDERGFCSESLIDEDCY